MTREDIQFKYKFEKQLALDESAQDIETGKRRSARNLSQFKNRVSDNDEHNNNNSETIEAETVPPE